MKGDATDLHARAWQPDPARTMRVDVFVVDDFDGMYHDVIEGSLLDAIAVVGERHRVATGLDRPKKFELREITDEPAKLLVLADFLVFRVTRESIEVPERPEGVPYVVTYGYWTARAEAAETALRALHEWVDPNEIHERDDDARTLHEAGVCGACGDVWPCPVVKARAVLEALPEEDLPF